MNEQLAGQQLTEDILTGVERPEELITKVKDRVAFALCCAGRGETEGLTALVQIGYESPASDLYRGIGVFPEETREQQISSAVETTKGIYSRPDYFGFNTLQGKKALTEALITAELAERDVFPTPSAPLEINVGSVEERALLAKGIREVADLLFDQATATADTLPG